MRTKKHHTETSLMPCRGWPGGKKFDKTIPNYKVYCAAIINKVSKGVDNKVKAFAYFQSYFKGIYLTITVYIL